MARMDGTHVATAPQAGRIATAIIAISQIWDE
jgi:hypothetical protein